jgi:beta-lactamase superfamily II metal-dependent hydrolase
VLVGPVLAARLSTLLPPSMAQLVAVPLAAQLFCSPVLALIQPSLPAYSLPANIAASPFVPFITIAGMVSVVLVALAPGAAVPFALGAGWAAAGVAQIARFFAAAPYSSIPWPAGIGGAVLSAVLSAAVLIALVQAPAVIAAARAEWLTDRSARHNHEAPSRQMNGKARSGRSLMRSTGWVAAGCIAGILALAVWNGTRDHPPPEWTVAACDVGQGDGLAVRTGVHSAMVFDAGPDPAPMGACLDHLGVKTVDLLVLTHLHEDHYGGVAGVFAGRSVQRLLYSTTEEVLPVAVRELTGGGTVVDTASAGATGSVGGVDWSVLWPESGEPAASENDASAVVLVTVAPVAGGRSIDVLFTGDLEEDAAGRFLDRYPGLIAEGVDVLKVAHHGARNGGGKMIEFLAPRVGLISAGRGNDYGHPHPETVRHLDAAGVHVARTDVDGTVLITLDGDTLRVGGL